MCMDSAKRGSLCGNTGCARTDLQKSLVSRPAIKARDARVKARVNQCEINPSGCRTGMMLKDMSKKCISQAQTKRNTIMGTFSFQSMRKSNRKGTKKWPKMMTMPTYHQLPFSRRTYQKVSSGTFAFQIMKY